MGISFLRPFQDIEKVRRRQLERSSLSGDMSDANLTWRKVFNSGAYGKTQPSKAQRYVSNVLAAPKNLLKYLLEYYTYRTERWALNSVDGLRIAFDDLPKNRTARAAELEKLRGELANLEKENSAPFKEPTNETFRNPESGVIPYEGNELARKIAEERALRQQRKAGLPDLIADKKAEIAAKENQFLGAWRYPAYVAGIVLLTISYYVAKAIRLTARQALSWGNAARAAYEAGYERKRATLLYEDGTTRTESLLVDTDGNFLDSSFRVLRINESQQVLMNSNGCFQPVQRKNDKGGLEDQESKPIATRWGQFSAGVSVLISLAIFIVALIFLAGPALGAAAKWAFGQIGGTAPAVTAATEIGHASLEIFNVTVVTGDALVVAAEVAIVATLIEGTIRGATTLLTKDSSKLPSEDDLLAQTTSTVDKSENAEDAVSANQSRLDKAPGQGDLLAGRPTPTTVGSAAGGGGLPKSRTADGSPAAVSGATLLPKTHSAGHLGAMTSRAGTRQESKVTAVASGRVPADGSGLTTTQRAQLQADLRDGGVAFNPHAPTADQKEAETAARMRSLNESHWAGTERRDRSASDGDERRPLLRPLTAASDSEDDAADSQAVDRAAAQVARSERTAIVAVAAAAAVGAPARDVVDSGAGLGLPATPAPGSAA